jgi:Zn finger protein HypA/HybF involved in hydrogenase expression
MAAMRTEMERHKHHMSDRTKYSECEDCGWRGLRKRLLPGELPEDELCPKCGSFWTHDVAYIKDEHKR